MTFDIDKLDTDHKTILNKYACDYGMHFGDYIRMLQKDHHEKLMLKKQKILEAERAQFSV